MHEITIDKDGCFSLDMFTEEQKSQMNSLLNYCNLIVKLALEKKEFT